jgi:hypothetical protein
LDRTSLIDTNVLEKGAMGVEGADLLNYLDFMLTKVRGNETFR